MLQGSPATTLLVGKYEVGEPRLLGQGRYGPVIRARDVHSRELVAVKVRLHHPPTHAHLTSSSLVRAHVVVPGIQCSRGLPFGPTEGLR